MQQLVSICKEIYNDIVSDCVAVFLFFSFNLGHQTYFERIYNKLHKQERHRSSSSLSMRSRNESCRLLTFASVS